MRVVEYECNNMQIGKNNGTDRHSSITAVKAADVITLCTSSGAVYCNRSGLWVCMLVGLLLR